MLKTASRNLLRKNLKFQTIRSVATTIDTSTNIKQGKKLRVDRELPDPRADRTKRVLGFLGFSAAIAASLTIIFNYEKTENPIISTTLYQLRRSAKTKELLGENIEFDGFIPWVYGTLHPVQGKINITFYIKGDKNKGGVVRLIADRENRNDEFLIHEWSLTVEGDRVDILEKNSTTYLST